MGILRQETWSFSSARGVWQSVAVMKVRKASERGHAEHGWLDSYHTFSFADYYDPQWMGFRSLRVINDDLVMPGKGFGTHPHRDMEIITYVLRRQRSSTRIRWATARVIRPGDVQYMAAGTGSVQHSEFNPSPEEGGAFPANLDSSARPPGQWAPRYAEKSLKNAATGWHLVTSQAGRDGSMAIHQDADFWLAASWNRVKSHQPFGHTVAAYALDARGRG